MTLEIKFYKQKENVKMRTLSVPSGVKIGNSILYDRLKSLLSPNDKVMLIIDKTVDSLYGEEIYDFLSDNTQEIKREFVNAGSLREALLMAYYIVNRDFDTVIAMGGGKVLDVGKYACSMAERRFISIPTTISHDGVASPIAVLKCDHGRVQSLPCRIPEQIIIELDIIKNAPKQLVLAGVGDLVSNITALRDWETAAAAKQAEMNDFAYLISSTAVRAVLQYKNPSEKSDEFLTQLAESVVISGLAMNITGSTRPSSGAEHLISHAIDAMGKGVSHGLQTGMASILVEFIYGGDYAMIRNFLNRFGMPTTFADLGLTYEDYVVAMQTATKTRKGRYTILDEISLEEDNLKRIYTDLYEG